MNPEGFLQIQCSREEQHTELKQSATTDGLKNGFQTVLCPIVSISMLTTTLQQLQNTKTFTTQTSLFIVGMKLFSRSQTRTHTKHKSYETKWTHAGKAWVVLHKPTTTQSGQREVLRNPHSPEEHAQLCTSFLQSHLFCPTPATRYWIVRLGEALFYIPAAARGSCSLPSHSTTCREEKGKIQEQWTSQRNMSEGRISAWHCVTVMVTAKDNRPFPCLSLMMRPSWNSFFHFNYLLLHFPNILLVKIRGAGIQKAFVGASDAPGCVRFLVPGYVSINHKYQAHIRGQTPGMRAWVQTSALVLWQLSCSALHSDPWPSNTVTLTSCREEETGWPRMWTVRSKPYHFFWFASSKTFVLICNCSIWHLQQRGKWLFVHLFAVHAGAAFVPPPCSWNAESVSWNNSPSPGQSRAG